MHRGSKTRIMPIILSIWDRTMLFACCVNCSQLTKNNLGIGHKRIFKEVGQMGDRAKECIHYVFGH
jgi:hypothetical protein